MSELIEPDATKLEKQSMSFYKKWILETTGEEIKELRELYTGRVYVELMKTMLPACLDAADMKKLTKENSKKNMKLLQKAFTTLKLKKVIPVKQLTSKGFQKNYEFVAWMHSFFTANKLIKGKSEQVQKDLRLALQKTIKTSKDLIKECINTLNPPTHNVVICTDLENTYLSQEFETLKVVCAKYEKAAAEVAKKEEERQDGDRKFVEGLQAFYKHAMKAGEVGSHINVAYKHLEHYPKEDRLVKLANEVTQAGLKCIKLTRKAALEMQASFIDVDVQTYDQHLTKSLNDQRDCLQAGAAHAKLKFPESEIPVNNNNSSERVTWTKIHEARIRAEVILNVHKDKF